MASVFLLGPLGLPLKPPPKKSNSLKPRHPQNITLKQRKAPKPRWFVGPAPRKPRGLLDLIPFLAFWASPDGRHPMFGGWIPPRRREALSGPAAPFFRHGMQLRADDGPRRLPFTSGVSKKERFFSLGPPARCQLLPTSLGEGSPTKIGYRKKGHPYSKLSAGGPGQLDK